MVGYRCEKIKYKMVDGGHLGICSICSNSGTVRAMDFKFNPTVDLDVANERMCYKFAKLKYKMADGGHLQICSISYNSGTVHATDFKFNPVIGLDVGNEKMW